MAAALQSTRCVFITHAESDKGLADLVISLLTAVGVPVANIFSSSSERAGLKPDEDLLRIIDQRLNSCRLAIVLATEAYLLSDWTKYEIGAIWIRHTPTLTLRVLPVEHHRLPYMLARLHTKCLDSDAESLASEVANQATTAVGLSGVNSSTVATAVNTFIESLPQVLMKMAANPSRRLVDHRLDIRHARVGECTALLHEVSHKLRDAASVGDVHKQTRVIARMLSTLSKRRIKSYQRSSAHRESFFSNLTASLNAMAQVFDEVTGQENCRVCVKQLVRLDNTNTDAAVEDLARARNVPLKNLGSNRALVSENTHFQQLRSTPARWFASNDLISLFNSGGYHNSNWGDSLPEHPEYVATCVWPIRRLNPDQRVAQDLLGFLCVDALKTNTFAIEAPNGGPGDDWGLGAMFADHLYTVLRPWLL